MQEKIIDENKQGSPLVMEPKQGNSKSFYRKLWLPNEF